MDGFWVCDMTRMHNMFAKNEVNDLLSLAFTDFIVWKLFARVFGPYFPFDDSGKTTSAKFSEARALLLCGNE